MNTGVPWPVDVVDTTVAWHRVLAMQTKLHRWATTDPGRRFDDVFNLVHDPAFLLAAWDRVRGNKGGRTAGVDGIVPRYVALEDVTGMLADLRQQVKSGEFTPLPARRRGTDPIRLVAPARQPVAAGCPHPAPASCRSPRLPAPRWKFRHPLSKGTVMLLAHAVTLAEARSYVATLADNAVTIDASIEYDRVLLQIDFIHGDLIPAISPVEVTDRDVLFTVAESAIEDLATHGIDSLTVELVLDMLYAARELDAP